MGKHSNCPNNLLIAAQMGPSLGQCGSLGSLTYHTVLICMLPLAHLTHSSGSQVVAISNLITWLLLVSSFLNYTSWIGGGARALLLGKWGRFKPKFSTLYKFKGGSSSLNNTSWMGGSCGQDEDKVSQDKCLHFGSRMENASAC